MSILSPTRAAELKPLVEIIESGEYESSEDMAKALLKAATDIVLGREWYAAILGDASKWQFGYGLFPSRRAAEKACIIGPARVFKVTPGVKFLESVYSPERAGELIERGD